MFGRCKVCEEKDRRIVDLKQQITMLRELSLPRPTFSAASFEANQILNGRSETLDLSAEKIKENEEIQREASRIISGDY